MILILDIENLAVLLALTILLIFGFRKKSRIDYTEDSLWSFFVIDKKTSVAIKGIACVFVLMGHYGTWSLETGNNVGVVTTLVTHSTANIALAWFMFFSGYGLSLKQYEKGTIFSTWIKRLKKLYPPLLYVCICATLIYIVLPYSNLRGAISVWYEDLHQLNMNNLSTVLYYTSGLNDWYVVCIIYFVSLFYLSVYISKKTQFNLSLLLGAALLLYIVIAYLVYGPPQAHFYRYPWAFMFGHLVAAHSKNDRKISIGLAIVFFLSWGLLDKISISCYVIAILLLLLFGTINKKYGYKGKHLLYLGGISYFYYLSHGRIGWALIMISGVDCRDLIVWILLTLLCSLILDKGYNYISKKLCL